MEWSFRMEEEMKVSKTAYFVTLTYSPETIPFITTGKRCKKCTKSRNKTQCHKCRKKEPDGKFVHWKGTLNPYDLTTFFKRLRKNQEKGGITMEHLTNNIRPGDKIRYFAAGEYGELRGRPHYHAVIFNASRARIEESWNLGAVHIVKANQATINYLMKYLDKGLGKKQNWKRHPEYNTMSEGIGESYLDKHTDWHRRNIDILYVSNDKGIRIPMPRYYREQLFSDKDKKEQIKIVTERLEEKREEEIREDGLENYNNNQAMKRRFSEIRFQKKIKKRNVD